MLRRVKMNFIFKLDQAIQAAAYFLIKTNGSMDCMKLLRLLYLADRNYILV